jgi:hypothetical protein
LDAKYIELLDWFAGQALAGLLASMQQGPRINYPLGEGEGVRYSQRAYDLAECMVRERARRAQAAKSAG